MAGLHVAAEVATRDETPIAASTIFAKCIIEFWRRQVARLQRGASESLRRLPLAVVAEDVGLKQLSQLSGFRRIKEAVTNRWDNQVANQGVRLDYQIRNVGR